MRIKRLQGTISSLEKGNKHVVIVSKSSFGKAEYLSMHDWFSFFLFFFPSAGDHCYKYVNYAEEYVCCLSDQYLVDRADMLPTCKSGSSLPLPPSAKCTCCAHSWPYRICVMCNNPGALADHFDVRFMQQARTQLTLELLLFCWRNHDMVCIAWAIMHVSSAL